MDRTLGRRSRIARILGPAALPTLVAIVLVIPPVPPGRTVLRLVSGVTEGGHATEQWLAMLRKRLSPDAYDSVAPLRRPMTPDDSAWSALIASRLPTWEGMVPELAVSFPAVSPPPEVLIVAGNRGAEDAFSHDATTIGFDLAALQANYGDAGHSANGARIDRFFRHEFTHLLQKGWLRLHPWEGDSPIQAAILDIWLEGLGNYYSLSDRWRAARGERSAAAAAALHELEPRLVARLSALGCASPEAAAPLLADLSWGRFDQKWGALTAALWLEEETQYSADALGRFVAAGPAGVWELAARHLPEPLTATLAEARTADSLCTGASDSALRDR